MIVSRRSAIIETYRNQLAILFATVFPGELAANLPQQTLTTLVRMMVAQWVRGRLLEACSLRYCEACGKVWLDSFRPCVCPQCGQEAGVARWSINHQSLRWLIRKAELDAGLLMPMPFTSKHYPRTFRQAIQLHRLRSGRVKDRRTTTEILEGMKAEREQESREQFRRTRMGMLTWKMHQWEDGTGPKLSLWQLAHNHGGIEAPASKVYKQVKEAWVSENISGREAIEQVLGVNTQP